MRLYRKILSQAWHITWHNKYLWFFGLFAALLGAGGEYEIISRGIVGPEQELFPGLARLLETGFFSLATLKNIGSLIATEPFSILTLLFVWLLILVVLVFIVWLVNVSEAAIVSASVSKASGKGSNFQENLKIGIRKFWPIFGINLIQKAVISLAVIIISLPVIFGPEIIASAFQGISFWILYIIFIPVVLIISFVLKYSVAYIVIKSSGMLEAIKSGWRLFVKNWLVSLEMAIFLFVLNVVVSFTGLLAVMVVAVPLIFLAGFLGQLISVFLFWLILIIGLFILILAIALVGASLATFQISAWTGLFAELSGKGGVSKLERMFDKIK